MSKITYDPEVWFLLKAIWQAFPKISFEKLCHFVESVTDKPVPSPSTVARKCKTEKWVKNIRSYCAKSDSSLEKVKSRLLRELKEEYEKIQEDNRTVSDMTNGALTVKSGVSRMTFKVLEKVAHKNRKTVDVLKEHRQRMGKIGQLLDDSMDWMYEAKQSVFDENATPEQLQKAEKKFGLLETMVEKIESFSRTAKNLAYVDFQLYGINVDDTRDSDTDNRMNSLLDESKFDQARQDLQQQYKEMQQQSAWIMEGHFEREVQEMMEEQMRREQAEDAEFTEIDDEEDYSSGGG